MYLVPLKMKRQESREDIMGFNSGLMRNSSNQIRDPRVVSMADADMHFQKDSTNMASINESEGGLPQTEDAENMETLAKPQGLFNYGGSQATVNDDRISAAFGGDN